MKVLKQVFISVCIYFALFYERSLIWPNEYTAASGSTIGTYLILAMQRFLKGLGEYTIQGVLCFAGIFLLVRYVDSRERNIKKTEGFLAIIFAFFMVLGESFHLAGSWQLFFGDWQLFLTSLVMMIGYMYILYHLIIFLMEKLLQNGNSNVSKSKNWFTWWIIIFTSWSPYYLFRYPGAMCADSHNQMSQFFGVLPWGTAHPPFSTLLIGIPMWIGEKTINIEFGIFLYCVFQGLLLSGVFAYSLKGLREMGVSTKYIKLALMLYALNPLFPLYATTVLKDVPYSAMILMFVVGITNCVRAIKQSKKINIADGILSCTSALLAMLLRHNGIYAVIPCLLALVVYAAIKHVNWKKVLLYAGMTAMVFLSYVGITKGIYPNFVNENIATYANMALPMQQTARFVQQYPEEVLEEEAEILDKILVYDTLGEVYCPTSFDMVSNTYRKDIPETVVSDYYKKVWLPQLIRKPGVHIEATMHMVYGLFWPGANNFVQYDSLDSNYVSPYCELKQPEMLKGVSSAFSNFQDVLNAIPFIGIVENIAVYTWISIALIVLSIKEKRLGNLVCLIPIGMTILVCMAAPAFWQHPRYAFPILYSGVYLVGVFIANHKAKGENN